MYTPCKTNYDLSAHLISFLQDNHFYAELSRQIRKVPTLDERCPTAAVSFNIQTDELVLWWNPDYLSKLSQWHVRNLFSHEFYHPTLGHVSFRRKKPSLLWNIATDLSINSLIDRDAMGAGRPKYALKDEKPIPEDWLLPGRRPNIQIDKTQKELTRQQIAALKLADLIESFSPCQTSEYYFSEIRKIIDDEECDDLCGIDSFDGHADWDAVDEEVINYVDNRIKSIVKKAIAHADSTPRGWGNMSADTIRKIRQSTSNIVDWRNVLRNFVGTIARSNRSTSIKRINNKYPYIHPGVVLGTGVRLLIAIDQSASVDDEMLSMFFGELLNLNKKMAIDILPFDCQANVADIKTLNKNSHYRLERVLTGGTDFNAPSDIFNDVKHRNRWDALLIWTDGAAPAPKPSHGRRAWVLGKGCNLQFETSETIIKLEPKVIV